MVFYPYMYCVQMCYCYLINFFDLEIILKSGISTGIAVYIYNFIKFCYLSNINKSHTNQNVIIQ